MPHAAGGPVTIQDILRRVAAANVAQHFIRECLRVNGNAGCAVFFDDAQFFFVGTVRAARFHGKLFQGGQVKLLGMVPISWRSCCALTLVGVPPPIYSVLMLRCAASAAARVAASSLHRQST